VSWQQPGAPANFLYLLGRFVFEVNFKMHRVVLREPYGSQIGGLFVESEVQVAFFQVQF